MAHRVDAISSTLRLISPAEVRGSLRLVRLILAVLLSTYTAEHGCIIARRVEKLGARSLVLAQVLLEQRVLLFGAAITRTSLIVVHFF